jgi:hypothetical protein
MAFPKDGITLEYKNYLLRTQPNSNPYCGKCTRCSVFAKGESTHLQLPEIKPLVWECILSIPVRKDLERVLIHVGQQSYTLTLLP